jgi:hypothetical protein
MTKEQTSEVQWDERVQVQGSRFSVQGSKFSVQGSSGQFIQGRQENIAAARYTERKLA